MTKKKEHKDIFQSNYGGGNVTAAQYIIELICAKKAGMAKQILSYKFWTDTEWGMFYKRWLKPVHKLLRQYDAMAIINALNDKHSGMKWSLHTEFMIGLIKEHSKKLKSTQRELKINPDTIDKSKNSIPRQPQGGIDFLDIDTTHLDLTITEKAIEEFITIK